MTRKAVLFDLDGTLLDTIEDIATSVNRALRHLGFPLHEVGAYKYFVGDGREMMALRSLPTHSRDAATVARLVSRIGEEYARHWSDNTHPYEGVPELLSALTSRGIRMAILSNKPHDLTELMVSKLLPHWQFHPVVGARSSVPKKPDPGAAMDIARKLDLRPSDFLYVGDSDVDMKTATAAGMYPVGALWGFRTANELVAGGAKVLIESPTDLPGLL